VRAVDNGGLSFDFPSVHTVSNVMSQIARTTGDSTVHVTIAGRDSTLCKSDVRVSDPFNSISKSETRDNRGKVLGRGSGRSFSTLGCIQEKSCAHKPSW